MKKLSLILAVVLCGCTTARHKVGSSMARTGQASGKTGSMILGVSGVHVLTWELAVTSIPFFVIAFPFYYGGCALSGDESEPAPFDL